MNECASWQECLTKNFAVKVTINKAKVRSLIETSDARIIFYQESKLTEDNANFIFEGHYASVLEVMHALVLLNGFKIENHICLGYYLRDILKRNDLFRIFDDCRYKRNSLVYYGKRMDFDIAKDTIDKIKFLLKELKVVIKSFEN